MGTELQVAPKETRLAHPLEFTNEQTRILAETVAKGCDQNELAFFLNVCKIKRLDPFTGQVHCVKRWDSTLGKEKMSIQVGIDGFRVIAARSNELAGISEPEFDSEDAQYPGWAHVTVYRYGRDNEKIPYAAKARYNEYVQTKKDGSPNHMWATKPYIMLGKCAEALALRKAFPDELSGMYSDEEMGQADNEGGVTPASATKKPPVQQPSRASEKKPEPQQTSQGQQTTQQTQQPAQGQQKAETQSRLAGEEELSGIIETVKYGKEGAIWLSLKNGVLTCVGANHIDSDMKPGYFVKFRGVMQKREKLNFFTFLALIELSPVQDGSVAESAVVEREAQAMAKDAPLAPDAAAVADEMFGKQGSKAAAVQGLVDSGQVVPASQVPVTTKPGTIGKKKAQRIYAIANQNVKTTGFTEENIKKILAALYPDRTEQHLSELENGKYEWMEKLCTGEEGWADYLPD